jgi:hypothetical protein
VSLSRPPSCSPTPRPALEHRAPDARVRRDCKPAFGAALPPQALSAHCCRHTHTHTHTINMLSMQDVKRGQGTRQRRWYQEARPMMISGSKADHLRVSQDLRRVAWEESTNANTSPIKCSSSCTDPCVSACGHGAQRIVWRESGEKRSGTHQRPGDTARFGACAREYMRMCS